MELLGVGPMELVFVLILALIILGPKDMVKISKQTGAFLRRVVMSDTWKAIKKTSKELETLPNRLMREAGIEEDLQEVNKIANSVSGGKTNFFQAPAGSRPSDSPQPVSDTPVLDSPPLSETPAKPATPPSDLHN